MAALACSLVTAASAPLDLALVLARDEAEPLAWAVMTPADDGVGAAAMLCPELWPVQLSLRLVTCRLLICMAFLALEMLCSVQGACHASVAWMFLLSGKATHSHNSILFCLHETRRTRMGGGVEFGNKGPCSAVAQTQ